MPQIYTNKSPTTNKINKRDYSLNETEIYIKELIGKSRRTFILNVNCNLNKIRLQFRNTFCNFAPYH